MGKPPNLYSFSKPADIPNALRHYILKCQNEALGRHGAFRVAVSGGSLPRVMSEGLLAPGDGSPEDVPKFEKWEMFFADERCVALDHEDSNYKLVKDNLLDKIADGSSKPKVYTIDERYLDNVQEMADEYEKSLISSFAAKDTVKLPFFDLILLGCGPDGHTCSLFPGHELLRETDGWVLAISDSPKPPPRRITLSLPVVTFGANIAFLASGEGKREILKQIFDAEEGRSLPSALVNAGGEDRVSWFCDTAATQDVSFPKRSSL